MHAEIEAIFHRKRRSKTGRYRNQSRNSLRIPVFFPSYILETKTESIANFVFAEFGLLFSGISIKTIVNYPVSGDTDGATSKEGEHNMTIVHLEPEEFAEIMTASGQPVGVHCIVLDCLIAAMIYTCRHGEYLYYMDRICVSSQKQEEASQINPDCLHAEVYRKMALDMGAGRYGQHMAVCC